MIKVDGGSSMKLRDAAGMTLSDHARHGAAKTRANLNVSSHRDDAISATPERLNLQCRHSGSIDKLRPQKQFNNENIEISGRDRIARQSEARLSSSAETTCLSSGTRSTAICHTRA